MNVRVLYFHSARKAAGVAEETLQLPSPATVANLVQALLVSRRSLAPMERSLLFAVNQEHAAPTTPLADGDVVAVMPPFSGG